MNNYKFILNNNIINDYLIDILISSIFIIIYSYAFGIIPIKSTIHETKKSLTL